MRRLVLGSRRRSRMRLVFSQTSSPEILTVSMSLDSLLMRIAGGGLPHVPGIVFIHDGARRDGEIEQRCRQIVMRQREIAAVARRAAGAASDAFSRRYSATYACSASRNRAICTRGAIHHRPRSRISDAEISYRSCRNGYSDVISPRHSGCALTSCRFSRRRRVGLGLRLFHRIEHRIQQIQRKHHQHARQRIGALQFPCDAAGEALHFGRALLRIDAIRLHVLAQRDRSQRVRIRDKCRADAAVRWNRDRRRRSARRSPARCESLRQTDRPARPAHRRPARLRHRRAGACTVGSL